MDSYKLVLEDFSSTFTEVDVAGDRVQKTVTHIDHLARCDEYTGAYRDLGAEVAADFEARLRVKSDYKDAESQGIVWALQNVACDWNTLSNKVEPYRGIAVNLLKIGGLNRIEILEMRGTEDGIGLYRDYWDAAQASTRYYLLVRKVGAEFTCKIYDDETARNNETADAHLLDTLTLTLGLRCAGNTKLCKYRYLFGCNTWDYGTTEEQNNDIKNLYMLFWGDPTKAYDGDISTYAESFVAPFSWGPFLTLALATPMKSSKIKLFIGGDLTKIDLDAKVKGAWQNIFEGTISLDEWNEQTFDQKCVCEIRIRMYNDTAEIKSTKVYELDFEAEASEPIEQLTPLKQSCLPYTLPFKLGPYEGWKTLRMTDPSLAGHCRAGCFRIGVFNPIFERVIARLQQLGKSTRVIWLKRVEGDPDPETGQPKITWEEQEIDCFFAAPRGGLTAPSDIGLIDEHAYQGHSMEPLQALDRIKMPYGGGEDRFGSYDSQRVYEVQNPQEVFEGGGFLYRTFTLKHLDYAI